MSNFKRYNVLFLSSWYPNRVNPTLGNFVQKHAEAVALKSNVISLFISADSNSIQNYEVTEEDINNVKTITVYYKKVTHKIPLIAQLQKTVRFLRAHLLGLKAIGKRIDTIDIIHHNVLYPVGLFALYIKKRKGIPYIITEHWTGYLKLTNNTFSATERWLSKLIAKNASCITPVTNNLKQAMIARGFDSRYEIVYNVVNIHLFYPAEDIEKNKITFLHISTLRDEHKNISGILRCIERLSKHRQDFDFKIMGDGDIAPHIQKAISLGIYNTFVYFDGTKQTKEVAEIMRQADCFVLFSNYENLPCVMAEALASGIPVVTTAVGGIPEHITEQMGIMVKPKDEDDLFYALNNMIDNILLKKYNAQKLSAYAKSNFSYESVSEKFHIIYQSILSN